VADADADLRQRSPWRVLLPVLLFGLVVLASTAVRVAFGGQQAGATLLRGGVGLLALWAVVDGVLRLFGRPTFLGTGRGLDRLFGLAQVAISLGVAVALLPNTVAFVEMVTGLVTGRG
jgi:hypothetical protein